jgi:hypothetical protein
MTEIATLPNVDLMARQIDEMQRQIAEMHAFIMGLQEMLNSPMVQSAMGGMFG